MSATIPPSKIINIFEATKSSAGSVTLDISPSLGLSQTIAAIYVKIPSGEQYEYKVEERKNFLCYILSGNGQIKAGERTANLTSSNSFAFAASETASSFIVTATHPEISILVISDVQPAGRVAADAPPDFPTVGSAENTSVWVRKGISTMKAVQLGEITDLKNQELPPWGVNLERFPPGTQSSNAHSHSLENEFALILEGKARYWHQGEAPERILVPGDVVGWSAGTGICHSLLNDASNEQGAGEDLVILVWGEDKPDGDKVHYATAHPPWWTSDIRWFDCPIHAKGPASGLPHHPRPEDRPYHL